MLFGGEEEVEVVFDDGSKVTINLPTQEDLDRDKALFDAMMQLMEDAGMKFEIPNEP